jgi:hypothetical protein
MVNIPGGRTLCAVAVAVAVAVAATAATAAAAGGTGRVDGPLDAEGVHALLLLLCAHELLVHARVVLRLRAEGLWRGVEERGEECGGL